MATTRRRQGNAPATDSNRIAFASRHTYIGGWRPFRLTHPASNTPAPGSNFDFLGLIGSSGTGPSISGENVAFVTGVPGGVYARINGELRVIANLDTPAPGATGTFFNFGTTNGTSASINGENVVFSALAFGLGAGIFACVDGCIRLIASERTPAPDLDTTFGVFFLSKGVSPAISGTNVVFASNLGIYSVDAAAEPRGLRGVAVFQQCFTGADAGAAISPCCSTLDLDADGDIDLPDLATFRESCTNP